MCSAGNSVSIHHVFHTVLHPISPFQYHPTHVSVYNFSLFMQARSKERNTQTQFGLNICSVVLVIS